MKGYDIMKKRLSVAIDGPSSSGKSTVAKAVAKRLNIEYIDSGAMYRYIAYYCLQNNIDIEDEDAIVNECQPLVFKFVNQMFYVDDVLIGDEIRTLQITTIASKIATLVKVRQFLVQKQQEMSQAFSVIIDGRDVATYILPDADFKFYVTASVEERAKRRHREYLAKGIESDLKDLIEQQEKRDYQDMNRAYAPLVQVDEAILIDSTNMTLDVMVDNIVSVIENTDY